MVHMHKKLSFRKNVKDLSIAQGTSPTSVNRVLDTLATQHRPWNRRESFSKLGMSSSSSSPRPSQTLNPKLWKHDRLFLGICMCVQDLGFLEGLGSRV